MRSGCRRSISPKLRLSWDDWPVADRELWTQAASNDDPFVDTSVASLSKFTLGARWSTWGRFLGFLLRQEPAALNIAPAERLSMEHLRAFVSELERTNAPRSVASRVHWLHGAARMMMPESDWSWLQRASTRLHAAVPASKTVAPVVTSERVLQLGLQVMDENKPTHDGEMRIADAIRFRNGLILAFLAFIPLRLGNFASLEIGRHLIRERNKWFVIIPDCETKNKRPYEAEFPEFLNEYLRMYLRFVRPQLLRSLVSKSPSEKFGFMTRRLEQVA